MSDLLKQDFSADVEAVMKKYDRESNTRIWEGTPKLAVSAITAIFSIYCILSTLFSRAGIEIRLTAFLAYIIVIGYLHYPRSKHHVQINHVPWYDWVLMAAGAGSFLYYCLNYNELVMVISSASKMTPFFLAVGIIGTVSLVELCRRCVGLPILCVVGALLGYTLLSGMRLNRVVYTLFYGTSGILSTPVNVCAKYMVVFIILGAFLERSGIADFFTDIANAMVGGYAGGPAKAAVVASALEGMVSGSSVANTVGSGSITIPLMKDTGYTPEFAGAVEAAASTGGQIMPPILGAAAFLMAEYMGVPYSEVAMMAIIPAFLYFAGIFISVHLEAKRLGLKGIPKEKLPKVRELLPKLYLLTPLAVLVYLVSSNTRTMQTSATIAILVAIAVSMLRKETRITPKRFVEAMEAGGKGTITVAVACAMAGIIAGCITVTGLGSKLISAVVTLSGGNQLIALVLTMLCCIVLGMGVPTTATFCIMANTCAPILTQMGIGTIPAMFFVFYFGIVADITPPVALAAYAGAAIAKSDPMKTGVQATRLAIAAFIIPYVFAIHPEMLLIEAKALEVVQITLTSFLGMVGVCAGLTGYLTRPMNLITRLAAILGGMLMIVPGTVTDILGAAIIAVLVLWGLNGRRNTVVA